MADDAEVLTRDARQAIGYALRTEKTAFLLGLPNGDLCCSDKRTDPDQREAAAGGN